MSKKTSSRRPTSIFRQLCFTSLNGRFTKEHETNTLAAEYLDLTLRMYVHDVFVHPSRCQFLRPSATRGLPNSTLPQIHYPNDLALSANLPPLPSIHSSLRLPRVPGHSEVRTSAAATLLEHRLYCSLHSWCQTLLDYSQSSLRNQREQCLVQPAEGGCDCKAFNLKPFFENILYIKGKLDEFNINPSLSLLDCFGKSDPEPPSCWTGSQVAALPAYETKNAP